MCVCVCMCVCACVCVCMVYMYVCACMWVYSYVRPCVFMHAFAYSLLPLLIPHLPYFPPSSFPTGWAPGKVIKQYYREPDWPPNTWVTLSLLCSHHVFSFFNSCPFIITSLFSSSCIHLIILSPLSNSVQPLIHSLSFFTTSFLLHALSDAHHTKSHYTMVV